MAKSIQERALNTLYEIPSTGLEAVKKLIWTELNYPRANEPLPIRDWLEGTTDVLDEKPTLLAQYEGEGETFDVIYIKLTEEAKGKSFPLSITAERSVINQLMLHHSFALFIFSNPDETHWHFINVKYEHDTPSDDEDQEKRTLKRVIRRISVGPEENLRTAAERMSMLDLGTMSEDLFGFSPLDIQVEHDKAFDVQKVTEEFFQDYKVLFEELQDVLSEQTDDRQWAHDYALQFLNRTMFVYYVQRKRWLNNDPDFMESCWKAYQNSDRPQDSFVREWLSVLFFEAFNDKFQAGRSDRSYLPGEMKDALAMAPFLNGGLFKKNELDRKYKVEITDKIFKKIFYFFNQYNFTISEDTPLDQEVAVDPEMIGKVYESLVNVSEEADQGGDAGIFYTPRVEIDLMSKLSLVDWLANHLGEDHKDLLYEVVFAYDPEEKIEADQALTEKNLWPKLDELLQSIKVVDPACGSGSFLIGMLYVINDLRRRADQQLGREETPYERKKRIIGDNLYGVDVMDWAVHVAELRLWLQLVIETDLETAELKFRPLLPDLSFNIRPGDSLVQEVGGINLALIRKNTGIIPSHIKGRITRLIGEKRKYYNNDLNRNFRTQKDLQEEELDIFKTILDHRIHKFKNRLVEIERALSSKENLFGEKGSGQTKKDEEEFQRKKEQIETELSQTKEARRALKDVHDIPFVWDIAFVEVFEGEREGFDIVIGNPPYVRQERIRDPRKPLEESTTKSRKVYKDKLRRSVYSVWPQSFGYDWNTEKNSRNTIGLRSDLYLYFYFHGLSLLDDKGSFCFVSSNSWLDSGYGKSLKKFLLTQSYLKLVIDNETHRSFKRADVNTIIALISKPQDRAVKVNECLEHTARFVMAKANFKSTLNPIIWEEIESADKRLSLPEYRVFPQKQSNLLENGINPEDGKYIGDKWGGKYLRAPDIYFIILEKGKELLHPIGEFYEGERYLNTGGADGFFILTDVREYDDSLYYFTNENITKPSNDIFEGKIEKKYLVPLIKDYTKNNKRIEINGYDAYCLVFEDEPSKRARKYIKWGEKQGYNKRSGIIGRTPWYKPTNQMISSARVLIPRSFHDTYVIHHNPKEYLSLRFYRLHQKKGNEIQLITQLNSSVLILFLETLGNKGLGQGVLDFYMRDFLAMEIPIIEDPKLVSAYSEISDREIGSIWEELGVDDGNGKSISINPKPDRRILDEIIFDYLDLTKTERDAVYEELIKLVNNRLNKANSI